MKARVNVGFTKRGIEEYHDKNFTNLTGADIKAFDGLGNLIEVAVRDEGQGFRISLNGKTIASGYKYGSTSVKA